MGRWDATLLREEKDVANEGEERWERLIQRDQRDGGWHHCLGHGPRPVGSWQGCANAVQRNVLGEGCAVTFAPIQQGTEL